MPNQWKKGNQGLPALETPAQSLGCFLKTSCNRRRCKWAAKWAAKYPYKLSISLGCLSGRCLTFKSQSLHTSLACCLRTTVISLLIRSIFLIALKFNRKKNYCYDQKTFNHKLLTAYHVEWTVCIYLFLCLHPWSSKTIFFIGMVTTYKDLLQTTCRTKNVHYLQW